MKSVQEPADAGKGDVCDRAARLPRRGMLRVFAAAVLLGALPPPPTGRL